MELDIGKKIRNSRKEAGITQEKAAELVGVSRQTISNWENEKSYPDIISVIKMSDCYGVSLDYLLKGEKTMQNYYDYLEESTNVVNSNDKKIKIGLVLSYMLIWAVAMIVFWLFLGRGDEMGYSLMFLWITLPVSTLVVSIIIGARNLWGKYKFIAPAILGIMHMLAEYGTFSMANNVSQHKVNAPEFGLILVGGIVSLIGLGAGFLLRKHKEKKHPVVKNI